MLSYIQAILTDAECKHYMIQIPEGNPILTKCVSGRTGAGAGQAARAAPIPIHSTPIITLAPEHTLRTRKTLATYPAVITTL